jgi:hypothetical protein
VSDHDEQPDAPTALVERARALRAAGRDEDALITLEAVITRLSEAGGGDGARAEDDTRVLAFAQLNRIGLLVSAERLDEACGAAGALLALFDDQPDQTTLAGYGTMLLDVCFWLLAAGRNRVALTIAERLVARLVEGDDAQRAVAAGGRFFAGAAAGRLGESEQSRAQIAALGEMGEPALAALNRIAGQFGGAETNAAWYAQIAAATVTVLWRLDNREAAHALAQDAAQRLGTLGLEELAAPLRSLADEIAGA